MNVSKTDLYYKSSIKIVILMRAFQAHLFLPKNIIFSELKILVQHLHPTNFYDPETWAEVNAETSFIT